MTGIPHDPHRNQPVLHRGADLHAATGAVVLLHGRGASAQDILSLASEFRHPGLVYLAPQAAKYIWYPNSFLVPTEENEPWLTSALAKVNVIVETAVAAGIPLHRIALCGFSQGACLSTEFVARYPRRYGGLIALTGGLIGTDHEVISSARPADFAGMPAFFGSGDPDPHVPWSRVESSAAILTTMGAHVITERYPGRPHTVSEGEIRHADAILSAMLAAS